MLSREGWNCQVCSRVGQLADALAQGAAAVVTTEEAIQGEGIERLIEQINAQPAWSQLPFVILMPGASQSPAAGEIIRALQNAILLERPAPMRNVASAVQAAVRERRRQYQIRDQMQEIQRLLKSEQCARAEAERANRTKDEFLATVSHELRTPLAAILLWAKMLESGIVKESERAGGLRSIVRSAEAQRQLIEDLLDMARMMSGQLRLNLSEIDAHQAVQAAINAVRPIAEANKIALETHFDGGCRLVLGDPDRIQQIVWNLLSNAVKFTPAGGGVDIKVLESAATLQIVVSDSGKGIEAEFLPHVFKRFRQADSSITRRHGGLGLGLAIVRQLVELHGGTAAVHSDGPGRGATFTVSLPLAKSATPTLAAPAVGTMQPASTNSDGRAHPVNGKQALKGVSILLVEDEEETRRALAWILRQSGAEVKCVGSAGEGIEVLRCEKPTVIVSDIGLPGEDGYTFIGRARELARQRGEATTAALALTAYARGEDRERALAAGFQAYAAKPVEPEELIEAIANLARPRSNAASPDGDGKYNGDGVAHR
jgi:signal transduction histidine kinase/ActR/RegA family two-component response regulator